MEADSYFYIGASHDICQDYALSGHTSDKRAYAVLSDGCSGSPDTDFGSRLLCHAAKWAIERNEPESLFPVLVSARSDAKVSAAGSLQSESLDATLMWLSEYEAGFRVGVMGDGLIAARYAGTNLFHFVEIEFMTGYPCYLNYINDSDRLDLILEVNDGKGRVTITDQYKDTQYQAEHIFLQKSGPIPYRAEYPSEVFDMVAVLSDGVFTFQRRRDLGTSIVVENIPYTEVVEKVLNFKTTTGEFVKRRAKKFLHKECREFGWSHLDDLSIAALAKAPT